MTEIGAKGRNGSLLEGKMRCNGNWKGTLGVFSCEHFLYFL